MAHISSVRIANLALSKVGTNSTIESFTEDSTEASNANLWFDFAREQALAAFNWSFARKRLILASHSEDPPSEWGYRYLYPSDCIKARFIENPIGVEEDPVPFDIELASDETKSILTDEREARLIYTADVSSPSMFSPYFIDTFATILAVHLAFPLTGKVGLVEKLEDKARKLLIFAPAMDAAEKTDRPQREASWTRAR